jgi:VanZ family protein
MLLILWLASDTGSAEHTGRLILPVLRFLFPSASPLQLDAMHFVIRKLGHFTEYAILAGLWLRAFDGGGGPRARAARWAWVIAVAWAVVDETYQSSVGSRTGSVFDVALDGTGALAALIVLRRFRP